MPANSHSFTMSIMLLVQVSPSQSLTATQGNLTGSPFRYVNIYRCRSNGASDADFLSPGKNAVWCWEQSLNFAYWRRGWHIHDTRLVLRQFLTRKFYGRCGLQAIPLGPHPPVTPVSKFLDLIDWQAWYSSLAAKRVNTHQDKVIILVLAKSC